MTSEHTHQDNCLMCAVRALTSGTAPLYRFETEGDIVSGVVLSKGSVDSGFGMNPYVELWRGGSDRVRVVGLAATLRRGLEDGAPEIGDTVEIQFNGYNTVQGNQIRSIRSFTVTVTRGH